MDTSKPTPEPAPLITPLYQLTLNDAELAILYATALYIKARLTGNTIEVYRVLVGITVFQVSQGNAPLDSAISKLDQLARVAEEHLIK